MHGASGPEAMKPIARQFGVDSVFRIVMSLPQFQPGPNRAPSMAARIDSIVAQYSGRDLLEDHPESGRSSPAQSTDMVGWSFPTLFISGEAENPRWKQMADTMVLRMPHARKVLIPGGGHAVSFDEPARFNSALLEFLRAQDSS